MHITDQDKGKVRPRTGHDCPSGKRVIFLLFL